MFETTRYLESAKLEDSYYEMEGSNPAKDHILFSMPFECSFP